MKRIQTMVGFVCLASVVALSGCAADAEPASEEPASAEENVGTAEQAAQAYLLGGEYYYRTDSFDEACGASTLAVRTAWGTGPNTFTSIPRGDVVYLKPAQAPNGSFEWRCGSVFINGSDYSECNGAPADWVRFLWDANSRNISVMCFEKCGDGNSASDCLPY